MIREADANTEDQIRNLGRLNQQDQLRRKGVAACPACACCCFAQALFVLARTDVRFGPVVKSGLGRFFLADGQTENPVVTSPSGPCALLFYPPLLYQCISRMLCTRVAFRVGSDGHARTAPDSGWRSELQVEPQGGIGGSVRVNCVCVVSRHKP